MEQDKIWGYFQTEGRDVLRESYARLGHLVALIAKEKPKATVLNIGIGDGSFELLGLEAGLVVSALDPSAEVVTDLLKRLPHVHTAKSGRIEAIPFNDGEFDFVVASELFEHLDDSTLGAGLKEILRVCRVGLVGTVPADEVLSRSAVICPDCGKRFHRWGHVQSFDAQRMQGLLAEHFRSVQVYRKKFVPWRERSMVHKVGGLIKVCSNALGIRWPDSNLVFIAKK